jgi:hypothetical protein
MLRPKFPTQPNPRLGPINLDCHDLKVGFALLVKSLAILISFGVLLTSCLTIPVLNTPPHETVRSETDAPNGLHVCESDLVLVGLLTCRNTRRAKNRRTITSWLR